MVQTTPTTERKRKKKLSEEKKNIKKNDVSINSLLTHRKNKAQEKHIASHHFQKPEPGQKKKNA